MNDLIKVGEELSVRYDISLPSPCDNFLKYIPTERIYPGPYFVYFLWQDNQIVYVGQTSNVNNRVISHKEDKLFNRVSYVEFRDATKQQLNDVERQYINQLFPVYNKKGDCIYKCDKFAHLKGLSPSVVFKINTFYEGPDDHRDVVFYDGHVLHRYTWKRNHFEYKQDGEVVEEGVLTKSAKTVYRFNRNLSRVLFDIVGPKSKDKFGSVYVFATGESYDLFVTSK